MTHFGSIAMFAWGMLSMAGSAALWLFTTSSNHETAAAIVLTMGTIAIGFGFVLEAIIELVNVFRNVSGGR
jgi:hypothetical protein